MMLLPISHVGAFARRWPFRIEAGARMQAPVRAALALVILAFLSSCATPSATVRPAVVMVENHTDFSWEVAFGPGRDGAIPGDIWQVVEPRSVRRLEVPAGEYRVWRRLIIMGAAGGSQMESHRMTLAAGRTYVWPLATLFSSEEEIP